MNLKPMCLALSALLPAVGCGSVDASADYAQTSTWVAERTGVELPEPLEGPRAQAAREALLDALLEGGVTIDEAARVALACNFGLRARLLAIGASRADVSQAGLPPNPSLSLSASWASGGVYQLAGSLLQGVLDLLLIPARVEAAEGRLEKTKLRVARAAVTLIADVSRSFYDALTSRQAVSLGRVNLTQAERSAALVRRRFEAGLTDQAAVDLSGVEVLVARQGLLRFELEREVAATKLRGLLGLARSPRSLTLVGQLPDPVTLPADAQLTRRALADRLDLLAATRAITAAKARLSSAELGALPRLDLGPTVERDDAGAFFAGAGVTLTLPLWDQNRAQIAKASCRLASLRAAQQLLRDTITTEVRAAAAAVRDRGQLVRLFHDELLPLQERALAAAARSYEGGRGGILALTRAQRSLTDQRRAYLLALRDYARSLALLQGALAGRLPDQAPE